MVVGKPQGVSRGSPRLHLIYPLVCLCIYLYAVTEINIAQTFIQSIMYTHLALSMVNQFLCSVVCTHPFLSIMVEFLCPVMFLHLIMSVAKPYL